MSFRSNYLAATQAFDEKMYVEAVQIYVGLLKEDPDRIFEMVSKYEGARLAHYTLASQYAYQKIIIQRIKQQDSITLDLSLFTQRLPINFTYGPAVVCFLEKWKNPSKVWLEGRNMMRAIRDDVFTRYMPDIPPPNNIDADEYVALWVVQDFLDFDLLLPTNVTAVAGLGSGCCLFDAGYLKVLPAGSQGWSIEINPNSANAVTELSQLNGIPGLNYMRKWQGRPDRPMVVVSIRSCAFLYTIKAFDSLFSTLPDGSRVFLDVSPQYAQETLDYFAHLGAQTTKHARYNQTFRLYEFCI